MTASIGDASSRPPNDHIYVNIKSQHQVYLIDIWLTVSHYLAVRHFCMERGKFCFSFDAPRIGYVPKALQVQLIADVGCGMYFFAGDLSEVWTSKWYARW